MNAEQYMNATAEILEEDYIDRVVGDCITADLFAEAGLDLPNGLTPFGGIRTGSVFLALDADGEPISFIKLYAESSNGENACQLDNGRLMRFHADEPCSLDTWLVD